jgi:hypothetical protein
MSISGRLVTQRMKIWKVQIRKLCHEFEDLFPWRWNPKCIGRLVESIDNDIYGMFIGRWEHVPQTLHETGIVRLVCTIIVVRKKARDHFVERVGLKSKLSEKGGEEAVVVLFIGVSEIAIKKT